MKYILLILTLALLLTGCYKEETPTLECSVDSDCVRAGCSSQLCVSQDSADIITTCEYTDAYGCLAEAPCSCIEGVCNHEQTEDLINCLEEAKS